MENYEHPDRTLYYWIKAYHKGRNILLLPKGEAALSEESAYRWGFEKLSSNFDVIALPTRNTARASQMLKGQRIDQGQGEDTAFERLGHQIPLQEGR